jgi:hypothetical protein
MTSLLAGTGPGLRAFCSQAGTSIAISFRALLAIEWIDEPPLF